MTTSIEIWYLLVDAQGNPLAGGGSSSVFLPEAAIIDDLRHEVKKKE
jgi:hypothetical protein